MRFTDLILGKAATAILLVLSNKFKQANGWVFVAPCWRSCSDAWPGRCGTFLFLRSVSSSGGWAIAPPTADHLRHDSQRGGRRAVNAT
jgi:hypothetical protein